MSAPEAQQVEAVAERAATTPSAAPNTETAEPMAGGAMAFMSAGHVPAAASLNTLQQAAGNGAVARLLSGFQRAPNTPAGGAKAKPNAGASYGDLFDAFQEMTARAINQGGAGMDNIPFGKDLNADHRRLLEGVRNVLDQARVAGDAGRKKLAGQWQPLAAKLQKAVSEARHLGLSAQVLSAVADDIDLVGRDYVGAKKTGDEIASELFGDEGAFLSAMENMLDIFVNGPVAGQGILTEEVAGRKDAYIGDNVRQGNTQQRDKINGVKIGSQILGRHLEIIKTLQKTLVMARSEAAGSAYRALTTYRSIEPDLSHIRDQGLHLGVAPTNDDPKLVENARKTLEAHYAQVHQEGLAFSLTAEHSAEKAAADRKVQQRGSDKEVADLKESRAYEDMAHALGVIQNGLQPSPDTPGEWILTSGQTVIRVRDDQVQGLREAAPKAVKHYASLSASLADDAYEAFEQRRKKNMDHPIVHGIVSWSGDIDDLDELEMFGKQQQAQSMFHQIKSLADSGKVADAFNVAMGLERYSTYFAEQVGKWESALISRAGTWVLGLTIVKEVLTLLATAGAGDLIAGAKTARGISGLRATAEVAGATTTAGMAGGGGGYVAGQLLTGQEVSGTDAAKATRVGGGTGLTIGAAPGAVAGAKDLLGAGKAATTFGNVVRGAGAEVLGNAPVNITSAAIQGESVKDAALSSVASSVVSGGGSQALAKVAEGGKVAKTIVGAGVGGTAGVTGAIAAGKDTGEVIKAGAFGTVGGGLSPHVAEANEAYRKGGSGGGGGGGEAGAKPPTEAVDKKFDVSDVTTGGTSGKSSENTSGSISGKFDLSDAGGGAPAASSGATPSAGGSANELTGGSTLATGKGSGTAGTAGTAGTGGTGGTAGTGSTSGGGTEQEMWQGRQANSDLPDEPVGAAIGRGVPKVASRNVETPDAVIKEGVGVGNMFTPIKRGVMKPIGKPPGGTSDSVVVVDTTNNNKKYLFKPLGGEPDVPYAEDRGVVAGHYAERARAGAIGAGALGVETPGVRLVEINGRKGSLTEWVEPTEGGQVMGLKEYAQQNEQAFKDLQKTSEWTDAISGIEALDYLINNVDRVNNLGNYMIEVGPGGSFKRLVPIDQELSFTRTGDRAIVAGRTSGMPRRWTPELAQHVAALHDNPGDFVTKIRPLVGDAAVEGVMQRLDQLYENGVQRGAIKPGGGSGGGGGTGGGGPTGGPAPGAPLAPGGETLATEGGGGGGGGNSGGGGPTGGAAGPAPAPGTGSRRTSFGGPNEPPLPADVDIEGAVARGISEHDADQQPYGAPARPNLTEIESAQVGPTSPQQNARIDAATRGQVDTGLPHPATANAARARLRAGTGTSADALTVIRQAVGVSRAAMSGETGQGGLTGARLAGRCALARDLTAFSVAAQLEGTGVPATIRRYSLNGVAGRMTGESHQFTVVEFRFGDRTESFIVDPTYAQFIAPGAGNRPATEGDRARSGAGSAESIARLLEDGYLPLNGTTGSTYLDSLTPPGVAAIDVGRLLAGLGGIDEENPGASSHIEVGAGAAPLTEQVQNLDYKEVVSEDFVRIVAGLRAQGRSDLAHEVEELSALLQHHGIDNERPFSPDELKNVHLDVEP